MLSTEQNLAALQQESPQAVSLAAEIEELQTEYDKRVGRRDRSADQGRTGAPERDGRPCQRRGRHAERRRARAESPRVPQVGEFASLRLRSELNQLESILERTDGARIELAVSQAAFKYRYTVIRPAQVPRDPSLRTCAWSSRPGFLPAWCSRWRSSSSKDLLSNRILEPWQVERQLGLPVLGTLRIA